jgi:hypothetical protein
MGRLRQSHPDQGLRTSERSNLRMVEQAKTSHIIVVPNSMGYRLYYTISTSHVTDLFMYCSRPVSGRHDPSREPRSTRSMQSLHRYVALCRPDLPSAHARTKGEDASEGREASIVGVAFIQG